MFTKKLFLYLIIVFLLVVKLTYSITLEYSLDEDQPGEFFVANIAESAGITPSPDPHVELEYSFLSSRENYNLYFNLQRTTGILSTAQNIDRDIICAAELTCVLSLDVVVMVDNMAYGDVINIHVTLVDLNDHYPYFTDSEVIKHVSELSPISSTITLPTATDDDVGFNNVQEYFLESSADDEDVFRLEVQTLPTSLVSVYLVLQRELDAERKSEYHLTLVARDGGETRKSGSTRLVIRVRDANDNPIIFDEEQYAVEVHENVPLNSTILQVTATDADVGNFGIITYRLRTEDFMFQLHPSSGELYLTRSLNYEKAHEHYLIVEARDDHISQPKLAYVTVYVMDINDNAPVITFSTFSDSVVGEVIENSLPGTVVAYAFVTDRDSEVNSQVTCSINNNLFKIGVLDSADQFQIVTELGFDREGPTDEHYITMTCNDGGEPSLSSTASLTVQVTDANDHAPVFTNDSYSAMVAENVEIGASILQVQNFYKYD